MVWLVWWWWWWCYTLMAMACVWWPMVNIALMVYSRWKYFLGWLNYIRVVDRHTYEKYQTSNYNFLIIYQSAYLLILCIYRRYLIIHYMNGGARRKSYSSQEMLFMLYIIIEIILWIGMTYNIILMIYDYFI